MPFSLPDAVVHSMQNARRVVVLTGGGLAAEAQVPGFRDAHVGEWANYDVSELATQQAFVRNPRLVWSWYEHRRQTAEAIEPSPSHFTLVDLEQHYPAFTLITQTIDGLHWRAGSRELIEVNGCLRRARCFDAGHILTSWEDDGEIPPRCPHCGSQLRHDVVFFGEGLPEWELRRARKAVTECEVFLTVGSIAAIEPVSSFPFIARKNGALVLAIDADDSLYALMADYVIPTTPSEGLAILAQTIFGQSNRERTAD
jgi:NAD-dependent deacetylase